MSEYINIFKTMNKLSLSQALKETVFTAVVMIIVSGVIFGIDGAILKFFK